MSRFIESVGSRNNSHQFLCTIWRKFANFTSNMFTFAHVRTYLMSEQNQSVGLCLTLCCTETTNLIAPPICMHSAYVCTSVLFWYYTTLHMAYCPHSRHIRPYRVLLTMGVFYHSYSWFTPLLY